MFFYVLFYRFLPFLPLHPLGALCLVSSFCVSGPMSISLVVRRYPPHTLLLLLHV